MVTAQCAESVTLPCTAIRVKSQTYKFVNWYKVQVGCGTFFETTDTRTKIDEVFVIYE